MSMCIFYMLRYKLVDKVVNLTPRASDYVMFTVLHTFKQLTEKPRRSLISNSGGGDDGCSRNRPR